MDGGFNIIPPQFQVALAPRGPFPNGDNQAASLGPHGEMLVSLYEAPYRMLQKYKQTYFACNQAATTWSVGLTTTYTGFNLNNPNGSKKNLSVLKVGFIFAAAPGGRSRWFGSGMGGYGLHAHRCAHGLRWPEGACLDSAVRTR